MEILRTSLDHKWNSPSVLCIIYSSSIDNGIQQGKLLKQIIVHFLNLTYLGANEQVMSRGTTCLRKGKSQKGINQLQCISIHRRIDFSQLEWK
jgi:hypothetical protein